MSVNVSPWRTYKVRFGKHKGKSLSLVFVQDRTYVQWLAQIAKGTTPAVNEAIRMAIECLKEVGLYDNI